MTDADVTAEPEGAETGADAPDAEEPKAEAPVADAGGAPTPGGAQRIGLALSGGGHRAALWASGAMLALTDMEVNSSVRSIASVSGGSIANGVVLNQSDGYEEADFAGLKQALAPAFEEWSTTGVFFTGPATDRYVGSIMFRLALIPALLATSTLALIAWGRNWTITTVAIVAVLAFAVLVGGALVALTPRGEGPPTPGGGLAAYRAFVLVAAALTGPLALGAMLVTTSSADGWTAVATAVAIGVVLGIAFKTAVSSFGKRSEHVDDALAAGILGPKEPGEPVKLAELAGKPVHHVFCATDLRSGDHCYLSPDLAYGHRLGIHRPAGQLRLSTVVQASACLPGAFRPRELTRAHLTGPGTGPGPLVVLTDGGVYDNMADQWAFGLADRRKRFDKEHADITVPHLQPLTHLLVVNASGPMGEHDVASSGLGGELASLLACKDVLYDVSTAVRRRYLVDMFEAARTTPDGLLGCLVQITQQPTTVIEGLPDHAPEDVKDRAAEAKVFLNRLCLADPIDWTSTARANTKVPTTLGPVGREVAIALLHHAYVLTRINAYVLLDLGDLPGQDGNLGDWKRERFTSLIPI